MITNNLGYCFECRNGTKKDYGVMESYKILYKGDELRVSLVLAVDSNGKIVVPSNLNKSLGFTSLREACKTEEEVRKFAKSNKPYFAILGEFTLIAAGTIIFDKDTKEVRSTAGLNFYILKTVAKQFPDFVDSNGVQQPALICERVSLDNGLNCLCVADATYQAYLSNLLAELDINALEDRGSFLSSIVFR